MGAELSQPAGATTVMPAQAESTNAAFTTHLSAAGPAFRE